MKLIKITSICVLVGALGGCINLTLLSDVLIFELSSSEQPAEDQQ